MDKSPYKKHITSDGSTFEYTSDNFILGKDFPNRDKDTRVFLGGRITLEAADEIMKEWVSRGHSTVYLHGNDEEKNLLWLAAMFNEVEVLGHVVTKRKRKKIIGHEKIEGFEPSKKFKNLWDGFKHHVPMKTYSVAEYEALVRAAEARDNILLPHIKLPKLTLKWRRRK